MNIERFIAIYDKDDNSLLDDIKIDLSTTVLLETLDIDKEDDPDVYKAYHITDPQFGKLKTLISGLEGFDFNMVDMYLECYNIE